MIQTAFVLGAGLGTRLRPLTLVRPKPLVPVGLKPLVARSFDHLIAHGVGRFVINTHWLPDAWAPEFPGDQYRRARIHYRHEPDILETAGGLKNAQDLLGDRTFLVYNGDILTDLPLAPAMQAHRASGSEVTLVLRSKDGPLQVAFDSGTGQVTDLGGALGAPDPRYLFTGIYLLEPSFLARVPAATKIGVVPIFLEMIRQGAKVGGVVIDDGQWWDLGSREKYLEVHAHLAAQEGAPWISPSATVDSSASIQGASSVGAGAHVGEGVELIDTLVWPGAQIAAGSRLRNCVVTGRESVRGEFCGVDF